MARTPGFGVDVGGSGIKGCTVDLRSGSLEDARVRVPTPVPATPAAVAEVVHDIDLKDGKYQRPETPGIGPLIDGIALRHSDDMRRLDEGAIIFEALYAQMHSQYGA